MSFAAHCTRFPVVRQRRAAATLVDVSYRRQSTETCILRPADGRRASSPPRERIHPCGDRSRRCVQHSGERTWPLHNVSSVSVGLCLAGPGAHSRVVSCTGAFGVRSAAADHPRSRRSRGSSTRTGGADSLTSTFLVWRQSALDPLAHAGILYIRRNYRPQSHGAAAAGATMAGAVMCSGPRFDFSLASHEPGGDSHGRDS